MASLQSTQRDSAGIRFPPPVLVIVPFLIGLSFDRHLRQFQLPALPSRIVGALLSLAGLALCLVCVGLLRRKGTSLRTDRTSRLLIVEGPYRFSRNPIYLGLVTFYLGLALLLRAPGALFLWPVAIALLQFVVIRREERFLTRRFGDQYGDYRKHVRRWL